MNNTRIWNFVLVGVATLLLAGCSPTKEQHEKALGLRAVELHKHVVKEEWDACLKMSDPDVIAKKGTEIITGLFKIMNGLQKFGKIGEEDYRVDEVVLAPDFKTAAVKGSNRINNAWQPAQDAKWVLVGGKWCITL